MTVVVVCPSTTAVASHYAKDGRHDGLCLFGIVSKRKKTIKPDCLQGIKKGKQTRLIRAQGSFYFRVLCRGDLLGTGAVRGTLGGSQRSGWESSVVVGGDF